jgi:hypothetical protein
MTPAITSAYAQLFALGLPWISFHCAGMCGTLLISMDVAGLGRGHGPLRGAAILVLLVAMTTPMLLGVTLLPRVGVPALRRLGARLPPLLLAASGLHLLLISAAAAGWLPHAHVGVRVFGRPFLIMFF